MKRSIIITVFCACVAFLFWQCNKESVVEKVEYQRGNIVHYGSGVPSSTIGEIGDYYLTFQYPTSMELKPKAVGVILLA